MKKKLTLWIVLLPFVVVAQQTEFKNGALTIDFGKKKNQQTDSVQQQQAPVTEEEEEQPAPKPKKVKNTNPDGQEEEFNPKRDGLFRALFNVGLNLSQVDGDEQAGYTNPGVQAGVGVMVKFHKNLSVSTQIMYSMKGAYRKRNLNETPQHTFHISWDYVQVPLLFNVHDKKLIIASVGLGFGYLVRNKMIYRLENPPGSGNVMDTSIVGFQNIEPRKFDLCGIVGFQFLIKQVFGIGFKFEYSFLKLRPAFGVNTKVLNMYNNTIALNFTYILNPIKKKNRPGGAFIDGPAPPDWSRAYALGR
ncbi:MAG: porin family protein [Chitinophagales bacterium]